MYHFNISFQLATVRYLGLAQGLSCLAFVQLACLQLLQSVSLKSLSLAAYSFTVQGQDFGQTSSKQHCEPSNPWKLNEPHAALSDRGKHWTANTHTHTPKAPLNVTKWSASTEALGQVWESILNEL